MEVGVVPPRVAGEPISAVPGDVVSAELTELDVVADIWSADARMAREYAHQAAAIAELARRRRINPDRAWPASLAEVGEDFVSELALIRHCSDSEAARLAGQALLLTGPLAATWSALYAGRLSVRQAQILLDLLGDAPAEIAAAVQARVLPGAADCAPGRLADRARYHLYRLDAAARDRRRRTAEHHADVHVERTPSGLGRLVIDGPLPAVHAARDAVDQYARWQRADRAPVPAANGDGDDRPIGLLRATMALDLILRPWDTTRPPVTALLTLHAPLASVHPDAPPGAEPGELDGQLISAAQCREVLADLGRLHLYPDLAGGGSVHIALDDATTGQTIAVATRAELRTAAGTGRRITRRNRAGTGASGTGPVDQRGPRHAAGPAREADPGPAAGTADGPGLRPPPPTPGYRPTTAQRRLITTRDRTCRMPGCRRRATHCDIDHAHPYARGGPTACRNLCCLCRRHHRIKTHAHDWTFTLLPDGRLLVRTPSGITRTTSPPGWHPHPEPDPPWLDETPSPDPLRR